MSTRNIAIPASAFYPTADATNFKSARLAVKQSSIAVPSPRYLEWIFDTTAAQYIVTDFILPQNYLNTPVIRVYYKMATAIANEITWGAGVATISSGDATDMDADAFVSSTGGAIASPTVPGTAGYIGIASITLTTGTYDDGMVSGDHINMIIFRDPAGPSSDADSDAEFLGVDFTYSDV